jgi:hypothetical protein
MPAKLAVWPFLKPVMAAVRAVGGGPKAHKTENVPSVPGLSPSVRGLSVPGLLRIWFVRIVWFNHDFEIRIAFLAQVKQCLHKVCLQIQIALAVVCPRLASNNAVSRIAEAQACDLHKSNEGIGLIKSFFSHET